MGKKPFSFRRKSTFETLETRLVLTASLRAGAVVDEVLVTPTLQPNLYVQHQGPAALPNVSIDPSVATIVDLSDVVPNEQRYAVPSSYSNLRFRIDTGESYRLSAVGSPHIGELQRGTFGYRSYDADGLEIEVLHVGKYGFAADTILSSDLSPGDTSLLIADASGWSNQVGESAESRSLAWYDYRDSTGHVYDDYTYTRNVAFDFDDGLWTAGEIWFDSTAGVYRVPLNSPWDGPAVAAGTAVRNATSGPTVSEPFPESLVNAPENWEVIHATITGEWGHGQRDEFAFRPGTVFVQPYTAVNGSLWNEIVFGPEQDFAPSVPMFLNGSGNTFALELDVFAKGVTAFTGDFNGDGTVNAADYTVWRDAMAGGETLAADSNGDGRVDALDYQLWRSNFGSETAIELQSVSAEYGTASIGAGAVDYTSPAWFVGTDTVEYTLLDTTTGETFTSHVKVTASGSNFEQDAAVAATLAAQATTPDNAAPEVRRGFQFGLQYSTTSDQPLNVDIKADRGLLVAFEDTDDTLVAQLLTSTAHGSLALNFDGTFQYVPEPGFNGIDTFRYQAFDGVNTTTGLGAIEVFATSDELVESNMRKVAIGMLNHESVFGRLPIDDNANYFDENGVPHLSWRVHILRWVGYPELYNKFNLDEPWDSANNLPLLDQMPDIFRSAGVPSSSTTTRLQTFNSNGAPFGFQTAGLDQAGPRLSQFRDNEAHTILFAESGADAAVPWTKPQDFSFDVENPLAALGTVSGGEINVAMADADILSLSASIDPQDFAALVTINGNEVVDADMLAREHAQAIGTEITPLDEVQQTNSLRQVALSFHSYHDSRNAFPEDTLLSPRNDLTQNVRGLSWRVLLLPYIGHENLYSRFNLDEPWDSPTNLPLLDEMPDIYRSLGDASDSSATRIVRPVGPETGLRNLPGIEKGLSFRSFADGTGQTLLAIEAGEDQAVPWTKPSDPRFDASYPLAVLGNLSAETFRAAFVDGSATNLPATISATELAALVTRNGNELVDVSSIRAYQRREEGLSKTSRDRVFEMKELVLAFHDHEYAKNAFPTNTFGDDGTPLLSWHVQLLPFMDGYADLYQQFHRNEPWDSPHNLALLPLMPDIFRSIGDPPDSTTTRVAAFTGRDDTPFPSLTDDNQLGLRIQDITDGTSNTLAFLEAGPEAAVPWTKPVDRPLPSNNPFGPLGNLGEEFIAAFIDGHIETISSEISPGQLRAMITRNGGENNDEPPQIVVSPGMTIIESGGNTITNEFGVDQFYVVLDLAPTSNVVVDLSSSDETVATVDQFQLTFTPDKWDVPQAVAVRGVDNQMINADQTIDITVIVNDLLSDSSYQAVPLATVNAIIVDDEPVPPELPGDFNADGTVDTADYTLWRDQLGTDNRQPYRGADANGDGLVDAGDYALWRQNYGIALSEPAAAESAAESALAEFSPAPFIGFDAADAVLSTPRRLHAEPSVMIANDTALLLLVAERDYLEDESDSEDALRSMGEAYEGNDQLKVRLAAGEKISGWE